MIKISTIIQKEITKFICKLWSYSYILNCDSLSLFFFSLKRRAMNYFYIISRVFIKIKIIIFNVIVIKLKPSEQVNPIPESV
jgi:hypothetical protein